MRIQEAVRLRILQLCREKNMTVNHLAEVSGVSSSALKLTVSSYARVKNTGVVTIKKLCQGFGIDFLDFFASDLFDNLDDEEES
ncbi:helix-turn-helix domain-containing protein [Gemmiger sp.]